MTVLSASQRARRTIDSTWGRIFNSQFVDLSKKGHWTWRWTPPDSCLRRILRLWQHPWRRIFLFIV